MTEYTATIDGGSGGTRTFRVSNLNVALMAAVRWAKQGEWRQDGTVTVVVKGPDGEAREDVEVTQSDLFRG